MLSYLIILSNASLYMISRMERDASILLLSMSVRRIWKSSVSWVYNPHLLSEYTVALYVVYHANLHTLC